MPAPQARIGSMVKRAPTVGKTAKYLKMLRRTLSQFILAPINEKLRFYSVVGRIRDLSRIDRRITVIEGGHVDWLGNSR
jgi:hypothetical protein